MNAFEQATAANPAIDNQFPTPRVIEATDDIINLDVPFTMELPAMESDAYSDVVLIFANTDGSGYPQHVTQTVAVKGVPTQATVDNNALSPPFDRDQSAVVRCFIRIRSSDLWTRTPDSVFYTF